MPNNNSVSEFVGEFVFEFPIFNATRSAFLPASMESIPRLGPTVLSSNTLIGAGRDPALKRTAKSLAASGAALKTILILYVGLSAESTIKGILLKYASEIAG